jgi:hypothetical protein
MPTDAGAWLGNYGYLGVPGDPALFTDDQGSSSTVTITGVQVFDGNGNPATGWDLVTADAESTTLSEYIEWKTTATSGLPPNLYLLPNSPTSPVGDACDSTPPTYNALFLTGVGTSTVVCNVNRSVIMTGTTMLAAAQPTGLTSSFGGGGLQGTVVGLLLQA